MAQAHLEQLHTFSDIGRDPRTWVISCCYMSLLDSSQLQLKAGDDASRAVWFKASYRLLREEKERAEGGFRKTLRYELKLGFDEGELSAVVERNITVTQTMTSTRYDIVSSDGLAFDHAKLIACAIERLRDNVNDTDVALHLMPELFTLTELQQVYEVVLDKELLKAAFRRKVAGLVTETDHYTESAGHRPSRLYRRRIEEFLT